MDTLFVCLILTLFSRFEANICLPGVLDEVDVGVKVEEGGDGLRVRHLAVGHVHVQLDVRARDARRQAEGAAAELHNRRFLFNKKARRGGLSGGQNLVLHWGGWMRIA